MSRALAAALSVLLAVAGLLLLAVGAGLLVLGLGGRYDLAADIAGSMTLGTNGGAVGGFIVIGVLLAVAGISPLVEQRRTASSGVRVPRTAHSGRAAWITAVALAVIVTAVLTVAALLSGTPRAALGLVAVLAGLGQIALAVVGLLQRRGADLDARSRLRRAGWITALANPLVVTVVIAVVGRALSA